MHGTCRLAYARRRGLDQCVSRAIVQGAGCAARHVTLLRKKGAKLRAGPSSDSAHPTPHRTARCSAGSALQWAGRAAERARGSWGRRRTAGPSSWESEARRAGPPRRSTAKSVRQRARAALSARRKVSPSRSALLPSK